MKPVSELLTELATRIRSKGEGGKTTAHDLRLFLASIVESLGELAQQVNTAPLLPVSYPEDEGKVLKIVNGSPQWVVEAPNSSIPVRPAAPTVFAQSDAPPSIFIDFTLSRGFAPTEHELSVDYGSTWQQGSVDHMVSGQYRFYVAAGTYPPGAICFRVRASTSSGTEHPASTWASNTIALQAQESAQSITLSDVELFGGNWNSSTTHPATAAFGYPNRARFHFQRGIKLEFRQGAGISVKWSLNGGPELDQVSSFISFEVHDLSGDNYVEIYRYNNGNDLTLDLTASLKYV